MNDYLIGIDPSLSHTGIVILDRELKLLLAQPVTSKPPKEPSWRANVARREAVGLAIMNHLAKFEGRQMILVEDYAYGSFAFSRATSGLIEMGATLRTHLYTLERTKKAQVEFVSPSEVKKFTTGSGNAKKLQVATALTRRYNVDFAGDDNLYDAYALARMLAALLGIDNSVTYAQKELVAKAAQRITIAFPT